MNPLSLVSSDVLTEPCHVQYEFTVSIPYTNVLFFAPGKNTVNHNGRIFHQYFSISAISHQLLAGDTADLLKPPTAAV